MKPDDDILFVIVGFRAVARVNLPEFDLADNPQPAPRLSGHLGRGLVPVLAFRSREMSSLLLILNFSHVLVVVRRARFGEFDDEIKRVLVHRWQERTAGSRPATEDGRTLAMPLASPWGPTLSVWLDRITVRRHQPIREADVIHERHAPDLLSSR